MKIMKTFLLHLQDDATAIAASLGRLAKSGKESFRSFRS